jgi:hypothetical protein
MNIGTAKLAAITTTIPVLFHTPEFRLLNSTPRPRPVIVDATKHGGAQRQFALLDPGPGTLRPSTEPAPSAPFPYPEQFMDSTAIPWGLVALGYPLPRLWADGLLGGKTRDAMNDFQRDNGLPLTALPDRRTIKALQAALAKAAGQLWAGGLIPADWMPEAKVNRAIVHWAAGAHRASGLDRSHDHMLIEGDGELVRGIPSIDLNDARGVKPGHAAHTLNCLTGSIGVSLCCMTCAVERPFKAGSAPMTRKQCDALPAVLADLCRRYSMPVTPRTFLSHVEVQGTLVVSSAASGTSPGWHSTCQ